MDSCVLFTHIIYTGKTHADFLRGVSDAIVNDGETKRLSAVNLQHTEPSLCLKRERTTPTRVLIRTHVCVWGRGKGGEREGGEKGRDSFDRSRNDWATLSFVCVCV